MTEQLYSFEKCKAEAQSTNSYGMNLNSEVQRSCRAAVKYMDVLHRQCWSVATTARRARFLIYKNKNLVKVRGCLLKHLSRGLAETTKERSDADPKGGVKPHKSGEVSFKTPINNVLMQIGDL